MTVAKKVKRIGKMRLIRVYILGSKGKIEIKEYFKRSANQRSGE